jgi:hypothetical protein
VHVIPSARKTEICGATEERLKIRLHAPPVDGKANEALIRYIAERLKQPKSAVEIAQGHGGRQKTLHVSVPDFTPEMVRALLLPDGDH